MSLSILALGDCYFAKANISAFRYFFMPTIYYIKQNFGSYSLWIWPKEKLGVTDYPVEISSDETHYEPCLKK